MNRHRRLSLYSSRVARAVPVVFAVLTAMLLAAQPAPARAAETTPVARFRVEHYVVEGPNPLTHDKTDAVLAKYLGEQAGIDGLLAAADALQSAIAAAGHPFNRVLLPPQSVKHGTIVLRVVPLKVGKVTVRGNHYFPDRNIRRSVPALVANKTPPMRELLREMDLANQNPSKRVKLALRASHSRRDAIDADLVVKDRRPWTLFAQLNNTGTTATGLWRTTYGGQASNLFDLDQVLTTTYTTSPGHPGKVKQLAASYYVPLYALHGALSAYYIYSHANTGRVGQNAQGNGGFDVSGSGIFAGLHYTQQLLRFGSLSQQVSIGIDDRYFHNTVLFGANPNSLLPDVRSRPVTVEYAGVLPGNGWNLDFHFAYVHNLVWGGSNDAAAYTANAAGARPQWGLFRGGASFTTRVFGDWLAHAVFSGQFTNQVLIPGEQFGLGGAHSVRGFNERVVTGDKGLEGSFELWAPPVKDTGLQFLGFLDVGRVEHVQPAAGQAHSQMLASIGPGVRWSKGDWLSVALDVGLPLAAADTGASGPRGHLNVLVRY